MNRILFGLILFALLGSFSIAQVNRKVSLIVSECNKVFPDGVCYPVAREYVKYKFQNGELLGREVLMANDANPFEFYVWEENNNIYQNKFLISRNGDVFDLEKNKIIFRSNEGAYILQNGNRTIRNLGMIAVLGDRVYTRLSLTTPEVREQEAIFYFDLKTNEYKIIREVKDFPETEQNNFSPNNKLLATYEKSKIVFYQIDKNFNFVKIRTVDPNLKTSKKTDESEEFDPDEYSIEWIDNQNILTVNKSHEIVKVNILGKILPIKKSKLSENERDSTLPEISQDRFKNLYIYPCDEYVHKGDGSQCRINLIYKTLEVKEIPIGNSFDKVSDKNNRDVNYTYKGKIIGNPKESIADKTVNIKNQGARSITDYLAVSYSEKYNKIAYLKVWNNTKNNWIKLDLKWHPENFLIGWIEEK